MDQSFKESATNSATNEEKRGKNELRLDGHQRKKKIRIEGKTISTSGSTTRRRSLRDKHHGESKKNIEQEKKVIRSKKKRGKGDILRAQRGGRGGVS